MPDDESELAPTVAASTDRASLAPGTQLGPYSIEALVGAGGMGAVYRARDSRLGRAVAIKVVVGLEDEARRRFDREARLLAALSHPNVVAVHDVGIVGELRYLVMELLEGETLRRRLAARRSSPSEILELVAPVARALAAAHARGIVHRDLKPDNVFVCADGTVKVLDFGIAKEIRAARDVTEIGAIVGTLDYMAPEQLRGEDVGAQVDLFALGAIIHEALSGAPTFRRSSAAETMTAILRDAPAPVTATSGVATSLIDVAMRCLDKHPVARPASAEEVVRAIDALRARKDDAVAARVVVEREVPEVRYAKSVAGVHIAYQVVGEGPLDVVFVPGFVSNVEEYWSGSIGRRFFSRIADRARLVLFDKRGTGASDRVPDDAIPPLEARIEDLRAVMDAAGSKRAVVFAISEGGPQAILFSTKHPERTCGMILYGTSAIFGGAPAVDDWVDRMIEQAKNWGSGEFLRTFAPSAAGDPRIGQWLAKFERVSASPGAVRAIFDMLRTTDVRPICSQVRVPTLVLHREGDRIVRADAGRYLAKSIPGARHVELPGDDHLPMFGDTAPLLGAVESFLDEIAAREARGEPAQRGGSA